MPRPLLPRSLLPRPFLPRPFLPRPLLPRPLLPRPATVGMFLLAVAAPAGGQGLNGAMMAPVTVPEHCVEADLACHRARLDATLRREADSLLQQVAPERVANPVERLVALVSKAEPEAVKALSLDDAALRQLAGRALRQAIRF